MKRGHPWNGNLNAGAIDEKTKNEIWQPIKVPRLTLQSLIPYLSRSHTSPQQLKRLCLQFSTVRDMAESQAASVSLFKTLVSTSLVQER
jgi:hypothetical protein